ncbi:lariat debranching enzyme-like [Pyrus ussuriensis x Pyrus communis]|uniref:Lariat debranching enzyme-like n=1 Tax=Pyrus ussuriensis x Pyrus communis TaxID=2448454 RepID=A0A5N5HX46_9ROSA|nr:lariat debranching enzyme-like [Pyrus ussuriensis x Pyrus communis]
MKIVVEGCMHGDLDNVYRTLQRYEKLHNTTIDLLLCCGDFQAVRNERDLDSLNVPRKFRSMNTFWKYYSGEAVAPYPIFIGGNHEASNYSWELYYGGWAAPNIYFLVFAGVVKFGNLRIGHFERPPYNGHTIRSVYHVREYDFHKLIQVEEPIDIFLSHDWPVGITDFQGRSLGSKPAAQLLEKLKPPYWFSAHLHCKHGEDGSVTNFLALDKCLPGRKFLQVIEIESEPGPYEIQYDEEWLEITRHVRLDKHGGHQWVRSKLQARGARPFEFTQTVLPYNPSQSVSYGSFRAHVQNPQTESLLQFLELPYLLDNTSQPSDVIPSSHRGSVDENSEDIPIDDVDELDEDAVDSENENS